MSYKKLLIISGVGYKGEQEIDFDDIENFTIKMNIGMATALEAAGEGFDLFLISKSENKLKTISNVFKKKFPLLDIYYKAIDATKKQEVFSLQKDIKNIHFDEIFYVHSLGLNSAAYQVENNNPYQYIENLSGELILQEYESVVPSLLFFSQLLMPIFELQKESNICIVNSMSAIRAYPNGFSHSAAKAGLHNAVRSLCLELHKKNIFVSEVLPGLVDTGYYDNEGVKTSIKDIVKFFGYDWEQKDILPMIKPKDVAKVILTCLTSNGHILSVNMVSKGQIPHMGS